MSRRKILPVYQFVDNDGFFEKVKYPVYVQAHKWEKLNTHPHDGGLFKIVKPYNNIFKKNENCSECEKPNKEHGAIKINDVIERISWVRVCPGDWILLHKNEYWPCPDYLFHQIYKITPKKDWYENIQL